MALFTLAVSSLEVVECVSVLMADVSRTSRLLLPVSPSHLLLESAKCIDEYISLSVKASESVGEGEPLDPRLVAIVEKMLGK